jgi:hypothetical protein
MQKTAVGLFHNPADVDAVVRDIEALGFPRNEIHTVEEPERFDATGVMSFPKGKYEVEVARTLDRMGASKEETEAYLAGLRQGGIIVFATDENESKVDAAADVFERYGAIVVDETSDFDQTAESAPHLPYAPEGAHLARRDDRVQAGRVRQSSGGARFFVW